MVGYERQTTRKSLDLFILIHQKSFRDSIYLVEKALKGSFDRLDIIERVGKGRIVLFDFSFLNYIQGGKKMLGGYSAQMHSLFLSYFILLFHF